MKVSIEKLSIEGGADEFAGFVLKLMELSEKHDSKAEVVGLIDSLPEPLPFFERSKRKLKKHKKHKGHHRKHRFKLSYDRETYERALRFASEHRCGLKVAWRKLYNREIGGKYWYEAKALAKSLGIRLFPGKKKICRKSRAKGESPGKASLNALGEASVRERDFSKFPAIDSLDSKYREVLASMMLNMSHSRIPLGYDDSAYALGIESKSEWDDLLAEVLIKSILISGSLGLKDKFIIRNRKIYYE